MKTAEPTVGAGSCDVDKPQFALGVAFQWLRWGEEWDALVIADSKTDAATRQAAQQRLARIRGMKDYLGKAEKRGKVAQSAVAASTQVHNPQSVWASVKPPNLDIGVDAQSSGVNIWKSGPTLGMRVGASFVNDALPAQVRAILGSPQVGASVAEMDFMEKDATKVYGSNPPRTKPDWDLILAAAQSLSCKP